MNLWACERCVFVNAGPHNGELSGSGCGRCLCVFAAMCMFVVFAKIRCDLSVFLIVVCFDTLYIVFLII